MPVPTDVSVVRIGLTSEVVVVRVGRNAAQVVNVGGGGGGITTITTTTPTSGFIDGSILATAGGVVTGIALPLVIDGNGGGSGGLIPPLPPTGGVSSTLTNVDSVNLPAGTVVCAQSGGFVRASSPLLPAMGLITTAINVGAGGLVQVGGALVLSDWTSVIGTTNLVPRQLYYLDPLNPGKLTTTVPTATGQICQVVGQGLTGSTLAILVQYPIVL